MHFQNLYLTYLTVRHLCTFPIRVHWAINLSYFDILDVIYNSKKLYLLFWPEQQAAAEGRARVIEHRCAAATRCAMLKSGQKKPAQWKKMDQVYKQVYICVVDTMVQNDVSSGKVRCEMSRERSRVY